MSFQEIPKAGDVVLVFMRDHDVFDSGEIDLEAANVCPKDIFSAKGVEKNISDQEGKTPAQGLPFFFC